MERARFHRARKRPTALIGSSISVAAAAALGVAIYLVSTSLPQLVDAPAADPSFGALNRCLISTLREPRAGFAVAPGGSKVASYGASSLAVCDRDVASQVDAGPSLAGDRISFPGITSAAFDFEGTLWLAAAPGPRPGLWVASSLREPPQKVGDVAPVALVGLPAGVAALEASGRLTSFTLRAGAEHSVLLPSGSSALLAANVDGSLIALSAAGAFHILRSSDLSSVRREDVCPVQFFWWLTLRSRALIVCADRETGFFVDALGGTRPAGSALKQPLSSLVPLLGTYVQSCDLLPCGAPAPKP